MLSHILLLIYMTYLGIGGYFTELTYVLYCVNGANMSLVCGLQYELLVVRLKRKCIVF